MKINKGVCNLKMVANNAMVLVVACVTALASVARGEEPIQPNFVIIMADDLGYGDIGCYGNQRIKTPRLDQLAAGGLRFTDFHSSGAVCSPTRAGLMTGRYQQRAGVPAVITAKNHRHIGLPLHEQTFAEVLANQGYATAIFGKWHLGYQRKFNPVRQGFHRFHGFVSGNVDYFSHIDQTGVFDWWQQDQLEDESGYTTELITRHAVSFIRSQKDKPFCLYLPYAAPHYPYQGPGDQPQRTAGGSFPVTGKRDDVAQAYREMVEAMDTGIGQVVDELGRQGLRKQTLVWFFSDNGANRHGSNGPFRGHKGSIWEGGHRVPSIANWPGTIGPGKTTDQLAVTLDVFSTITNLAGLETGEFPLQDGEDLSRILTGQQAAMPRQLFWGSSRGSAMRDGAWKLLALPGKGPQLYDLAQDLGETQDLASEYPDRVQSMSDAIQLWQREVGPNQFVR